MNLFKIFGMVAINNSNANKSLDDTNNKASEVSKELQKKFETIGKTFSSVGEKMVKVGTKLTATVTTSIAGLATIGVKYNAQIEQYQVALTTLTGSAEEANRIIEQIKKDAAATPFDVAGLTQANQLLISTGLSASESRETILALGNAVSATGGGNDELSRMAVNLQQVKNLGKATALDIKQFAYAGIDIYGLLADYLGITKEEAAELEVTWEDLNGALINASQEGGKYFGAMENQSTTLNGRLSTLKDNFSNVAGILTESLVPIVGKVLDRTSELIQKFSNLDEEQREQIVKWAAIAAATGPVLIGVGKVSKGVGSLFDVISKLQGESGLKGLISNFDIIPNMLGKATNGFKGLLNPVNLVKGAFGGVGSIITKFAPSIVGLIAQFDLSGGGLSGVLTVLKLSLGAVSSGFTSLLGAILPIVAPIVALIGVIVVLKDNWDKVVKVFQKFIQNTGIVEKFNEIKEKIQPLIEKFKGLKDLFTVVGTVVIGLLIPTIASLAGLFNGVVSAISPLLTALGGIIDILAGIGSFIVAVFTGDLDKAGESVKKIGQGILDVFGGLWGAVKGLLQGFVDGVVGFFRGLWDTLVGHSIVPDTINSIIDWFKQLLGKPLEFVSNLKDGVVNFFGNLKDGAIEKATGLINGAKEKFGNLKDSVEEKVSSLKDSAIDKFNGLKDGAVDKFNSMRDKAASIFSNMKDKITNPISSAKDKVNEYVNDIKGFFNNFSAKIKMPHFNIKNASLNPADWIKNGVPKISVDWYAKAMDYGRILDEPTIFGMNENGQFMGAGEVGSETVVGTNSLMNMIQQAVTSQNLELNARMDTLIEILLKYLPLLLKRELCLDSGAIVGELTPLIDKELGSLADKKGRGR